MQGEHSIVTKVFRQTMTTSMVSRLAGVVGIIVDGIVIGSFLGVNALAAYGMVASLSMVYALGGSTLSGGTRNFYAKLAGQGRTDEANNVFTLGFPISFTISICLVVITYLFLPQIAVLIGASDENSILLPLICQYLKGFVIGVPFEQCGLFIADFMSIDSDNKRVMLGTITVSIMRVAGDFAAITLFNGSLLSLGLFSSLGQVIYFFVMYTHFFRKDRMLYFRLKGLTGIKDKAAAILSNSVPFSVAYLSSAFGGIAIFRILSSAASSVYIAAFSIYNSVERITGITYLGIANTIWTMSSIYYGEEDRRALNTLQNTAAIHGMFITMFIAVVLALFPERVAGLYVGSSSDPQALAVTSEAVRVLALNVPLYLLAVMFERYLMGTEKLKAANIYCFLLEFGVIVPAAFVMVKLLGGRGVWFACTVMLFIMIAGAGVYIHFWGGGETFNIKRLLVAPEFGAESGKEISISADTELEVMGMSHIAELFCQENGIDKRKANVLALCIEELGMNIINHGFTDGKKHSIDVRMLIKDDEFTLRMRDDCKPFNPVERCRMTIEQEEDPVKNVGIRLVMKMSHDVKYLSTMNTNNLIIRI